MNSKTPDKRLDMPFGTLLLSNIAILVWAMLENWRAADLIWVYWFQTFALSIFSYLRVLRFRTFLTKNVRFIKVHFFKRSETEVKITSSTPNITERIRLILLPLFVFCFAHFLYFNILISEMKSLLSYAILLAGTVFLINQLFTFFYQWKKDRRSGVVIDDYGASIWFRIFPVHFTLLAALALREWDIYFDSRIILLIFLILKTAADALVYALEISAFQEEQASI